ncbi:MAG: hypothetical protein ACLP1W_20620, partial [Rhodomicrobium sp.]
MGCRNEERAWVLLITAAISAGLAAVAAEAKSGGGNLRHRARIRRAKQPAGDRGQARAHTAGETVT